VQLGKAVAFTALDRGDGVFHVTIPKDDFLIYETAVVDGRSSEKGYTHPSQDVTGTIDLTRGTVAMHAVVARSIHFKEGCSIRCIIDEDDPGTLTVDLSGAIAFPDTDADGVADRADNCRFVANPDQSPVATPIITPPPSLTLASCADHHIGVAKAGDICDGGPVTITNNAPRIFLVGTTTITWTAHDGSGNTDTGTQTVTVTDTVAPTIACVPDGPPGGSFRVTGIDACGAPTIRLGSFVLANGETLQITPSLKPGVTLVGVSGLKRVRHFAVGPGENVINATDASGNVASASCVVPPAR
jgi:hypothetical protein